MKKTFIIVVLAFIGVQIQAQSLNQKLIDPDLDREILLGEVNEEGLKDAVFVEDWQESYDIYLPDRVVTRKLKRIFRKNKDIHIKVFLATWCSDSQQHLPHFVKLAHEAKLKNTKYYALNRQKGMDDLDFIDVYAFGIELVPTFIIYKGELEIGRIIEAPSASLEKDIYEICK